VVLWTPMHSCRWIDDSCRSSRQTGDSKFYGVCPLPKLLLLIMTRCGLAGWCKDTRKLRVVARAVRNRESEI
jgi:hypothetical protein